MVTDSFHQRLDRARSNWDATPHAWYVVSKAAGVARPIVCIAKTRRQHVSRVTGTFLSLATASAFIAACAPQQASAPQASTPTALTPAAPIEFRVVPERNPAGCTRFDAAL